MNPSNDRRPLDQTLKASAPHMERDAHRRVRATVIAAVRHDTVRHARLLSLPQRVAAAVAALSVLTGGVAYAAGEALPGDALYPLKRASENALVALLPSGELEHKVLLGIAARRAEEAACLGQRSGNLEQSIEDLRGAVERVQGPDGSLTHEETERIRENVGSCPAPTSGAIDSIVPPANGGNMQQQGAPGENGGQSDTPQSSPGTPSGDGESHETSGGMQPRSGEMHGK
jgi:hypothetical protein